MLIQKWMDAFYTYAKVTYLQMFLFIQIVAARSQKMANQAHQLAQHWVKLPPYLAMKATPSVVQFTSSAMMPAGMTQQTAQFKVNKLYNSQNICHCSNEF